MGSKKIFKRTPDDIAENEKNIGILRELIHSAGSIREYAEHIGISKGYLTKMLYGEVRVNEKALTDTWKYEHHKKGSGGI